MTWYNKIVEAGIKSLIYKLPEDKKQRLFDFYMLSILPTSGKNEQTEWIMDHVKNTLLPDLKQHLLKMVFFSISAEFRHIFDSSEYRSVYNNAGKVVNTGQKKLPDNINRFLNSFLGKHNFNRENYTTLGDKFDPDFKNSAGRFNASYMAVLETLENSNLSSRDFVRMAETVFSKIKWDSSYGGRLWANIAIMHC